MSYIFKIFLVFLYLVCYLSAFLPFLIVDPLFYYLFIAAIIITIFPFFCFIVSDQIFNVLSFKFFTFLNVSVFLTCLSHIPLVVFIIKFYTLLLPFIFYFDPVLLFCMCIYPMIFFFS